MSKKRGNGEGSITKRKDGRWMASYTVHTVNGPKRRHVYGKTRQETAAKLAKVLSDRTDGVVYDDENMTVSEYLDRWLDGSARGSVRQSTYERDAYLVEKHINPALGRIKLKNLSAAHVQSFYRDRLDHGPSSSTVHKVYTILHKALSRAVTWQMISRNVTEVVESPKPTPGKMRPLSPAEARASSSTQPGGEVRRPVRPRRHDRHEARRAACPQVARRLSGERYRKREAYAHAHRRSLHSGGAEDEEERRSIRLTPQAKEVLRQHLERQLWDIRMLGDTYTDHGLVFTTDTDASLNPSNMRQRSFARLLRKADLPHIRFHDLRHTCATLLLSNGTHPKFVQELLGHATIAITLDTYSHVMPSMGDQTARAMQDALTPMQDALS